MAHKIASKLNIPIVHTYHTVYEEYTHYFSPNKNGDANWRRFYRTGWSTSRTASSFLRKRYGVNRTIHVIPTGIDWQRFTTKVPEETKLAIKCRLGIPEGNRVLLYVGRLAKEKNLEELLDYHATCQKEGLTLLCRKDACLDGILFDGCNGWQYESRREYLDRLDVLLNHAGRSENTEETVAAKISPVFSQKEFAEKVEQVYYSTIHEMPKNMTLLYHKEML